MRLIILGMGGYGRTVADVADQTGRYEEIVFLDDQAEQAFDVCDAYRKYVEEDTEMYPAFGNNEARLLWEEKLREQQIPLAKIIHPLAYVSPKATIAEGCVVMPYAIVNTDCEVQKGCIINCGALVDHGCVLEEGVHVAPGAIIKGENRIPACMKIDSGEVVQNRTYPL